MSLDIVGGSDVSTSIDNDLPPVSEFSTSTVPTEEQVYGIITTIDRALYKMISGQQVDYEEHGPVGFKIKPSATMAELRRLRQHLLESLTDPDLMLDAVMVVSQWCDPVGKPCRST